MELAKLAYADKLIEGLGENASDETALSAIMVELQKNGYEVKTVTNVGSTYQGIETLEVVDSTRNSLETITIQQIDSTVLKVNLKI